ncbi:hypothetical protein P3T86_14035 (plasmid) [Staphylococcus nepalensis]|uniref:hypothetical protein n=1 Tax=Staphylococcus nepalensis TaxID=214473 RepID=UPI002B25D06B|nr:hypothetical protein [Staphylococcus nepalensis]WQL21599.1 hypothetical protein P3T86_14035 [Staphylococcus nepalensis]
MKNYILKEVNGIVIAESEFIEDVIQTVVEYKLREIDRYNTSIEEKMEYERYPYMNELYNLHINALEYDENNFNQVESIYNNPLHIPAEEYIKLEVGQYV